MHTVSEVHFSQMRSLAIRRAIHCVGDVLREHNVITDLSVDDLNAHNGDFQDEFAWLITDLMMAGYGVVTE
ncbi:hypothetical protein [Magnetospirillum molischianum]|uniref:Uncharacterized protein n=1 Tax=Magnetospirillum molischianum DSM 120 TaxID=1150626 RepID=H8FY09_MAGML|nr:hypothetical protein [Magnetospirillum molischianum]CCG43247.1 hypothetical protein PHAMO_80038 [Magnetospirillum molischianum DSM 120]